ncbi:MAG: YHS domain-containing protein, partial [Cyanobacteria bacterium P01_D01_bin.2]
MKRSILFSVALAGTMLLGSCATASDSTAVSEAPAEAESPAEVTTTQTPEQAPEPAAAYAVFAEDGVAIRGADPVAYFTEGEYTPGSDAFTHDWEGATWQFASAENRDLFAANPEEYA